MQYTISTHYNLFLTVVKGQTFDGTMIHAIKQKDCIFKTAVVKGKLEITSLCDSNSIWKFIQGVQNSLLIWEKSLDYVLCKDT